VPISQAAGGRLPMAHGLRFRIAQRLSRPGPCEICVISVLACPRVTHDLGRLDREFVTPTIAEEISAKPLDKSDLHELRLLHSSVKSLMPNTLAGLAVEVTRDIFEPLLHPRVRGKYYRAAAQIAIPICAPTSGRRERGSGSTTRTSRSAVDLWELLLPLLHPPLALELPDTLDLPNNLYPHQLEGIKFLATHRAALLGDDMGTGKTVQTLVAMRLLFQSGQVSSACVVCPKSVLNSWDQHLQLWAPQLAVSICRGSALARAQAWARSAHVYLTTYDGLRQDIDTVHNWRLHTSGDAGTAEDTRRVHFDLVVLDECQRVKNPRAQVTKAVRSLRCDWRWGLSGTPLENSIQDLQCIFEFLMPGHHVIPNDRYLRPAEVRRLIAPHFLRRRKQDVIQDLPPKTVKEEWLTLGEQQRTAYDRAYEEGVVYLESLGETCTVQHVLTLLGRLREICNRDPETGESTKLEWLLENLDQMTSEDDKCLVFSQFIGSGVDFLYEALRARRWHVLRYTGQMSTSQRQAVLEQFAKSSDHAILLLSLRAGGLGLNLTAANYVVLFDHWWNPATMQQATDRVHRIGQEKHVFAYQLWTEDTVEERVYQVLQTKQNMYDDIIDSLARDGTSRLTEEELFGIFGLRPPRGIRQPPRVVSLSMKGKDFSILSPEEFEEFAADLWRCQGFGVRRVGGPGDQGIDVIATRNTPGGTEKIGIQCKHTRVVGVEALRSLLGAISSDRSFTKGILVTSGRFSREAIRFANQEGSVQIIDGQRLRQIDNLVAKRAERGCAKVNDEPGGFVLPGE